MDHSIKKYKIERHDLSADKSLKSWSAADEYLLKACTALETQANHIAIYNDRFGFLGCHLNSLQPTLVLTQASQKKAIEANLKANNIPLLRFSNPLQTFENKIDWAIIKVPKSTALFHLFLEQISNNSTGNIKVISSFMTRHFTPKLLEIANEYFEEVEQSRAIKKARLLILSKKKETLKKEIINSIKYKEQVYKQYWGVFSHDHIDYATQYFLAHLQLKKTDKHILDLASGNGIIANEISKQLPNAEIHLMDDAYLAVESAKLNIQGEQIFHHLNNDLGIFENENFDLIVTNPPFHFEYEVNIQIALQLFRDCFRSLKAGGNLQLVANKHLNYKIHLDKLFSAVEILAANNKFIVYKCLK